MKTEKTKIQTPKIHLIYTNDPYDFNEDEMKEAWVETAEVNDWEIPEDGPSDDEIWQEWYDQNERDWDDIECEVRYHDERGTYLVIASLGLWNGRFDGGKIISGRLDEVIRRCFEDYNRVYMEGRNLQISATHHDGTNYFTIKKLTPKGEEYAERHEWDMSDRELHQRLFKDSHYSHCVRFFADLYGWKL